MSASEGRVFQILNGSALDGPGLRQVVFLSGCNLSCAYCHNIDAVRARGSVYTPAQLFSVTLRQLPYLQGGGVTLSGGEPLLQAAFCTSFFALCRAHGVHTALETNATLFDPALAAQCDLVIADIKDHLPVPEENLMAYRAAGCEIWLTNVLIRGQNDTQAHDDALVALMRRVGATRLKYLPLRRLCLEKYQALGLPFPYGPEHEPTAVPPTRYA